MVIGQVSRPDKTADKIYNSVYLVKVFQKHQNIGCYITRTQSPSKVETSIFNSEAKRIYFHCTRQIRSIFVKSMRKSKKYITHLSRARNIGLPAEVN